MACVTNQCCSAVACTAISEGTHVLSRPAVDVLYTLQTWLCCFLHGVDVYRIACAARCGVETWPRAQVRHLLLDRRGADGRDDAVRIAAPWSQIQSLQATQISLYAVQDSLAEAAALHTLDVELLFPERLGEMLPLPSLCAGRLRRLVLRRCYNEVLGSLAEALQELELLKSPKGAAAQSKGLQWPPRRSGLAANPSCPEAPWALVEAVTAAPGLRSLAVQAVAAFDRPAYDWPIGSGGTGGQALVALGVKPCLQRLCLTDCAGLGHQAQLAILEGLASSSPCLEALTLAPSPLCAAGFGDAGAVGAAVASLVLRCHLLRGLQLLWCGLADGGALALAAGLHLGDRGASPRLRRVDLSQNGIGPVAPALVAALVRCAPRLEWVGLVGGSADGRAVEKAAGLAAGSGHSPTISV